MTTDLAASSNTNLLSYGSGGEKSRVCLTGLKSRRWQVWFLLEPLGESRVEILEAVYSSLLVPLLSSKSADEHLQTSF